MGVTDPPGEPIPSPGEIQSFKLKLGARAPRCDMIYDGNWSIYASRARDATLAAGAAAPGARRRGRACSATTSPSSLRLQSPARSR